MSAKIRKFLEDDVPFKKWAALFAHHSRRQEMMSNIGGAT